MNRPTNKRWGKKLLLFFCTLFIMLGTVVASQTMNQSKLSASTSDGPTFQLYDKIQYGLKNKYFTVVSTGSEYGFLADTLPTTSKKNFKATIDYIPTYLNSFGNLGKTAPTEVKLPEESDLTQASTTSGNVITLNSQIPKISYDWWLGDASVKNRSKYMTKENKNNGTYNIVDSVVTSSNTCGTQVTGTETGVFPTSEEDGQSASKVVADSGYVLVLSELTRQDTGGSNPYINAYQSTNCTGTSKKVSFKDGTSSDEKAKKVKFEDGKSEVLDYAMVWQPAARALIGIWGLEPKTGATLPNIVMTPGTCYSFSKDNTYLSGATKGVYSFNLNTPSNANVVISGISVKDASKLSSKNLDCTNKRAAGTATFRPLIKLSESSIIRAGRNARDFTVSDVINKTSSDAGSIYDNEGSVNGSVTTYDYLTVKSPSLSIALDTSNSYVDGNTLSAERPQGTNTIDIPVAISGVQDYGSSGRFVSAKATDVNGNEVYGVLGKLTSTTGVVTLDISNLVSDSDTSFQLTLYEEDQGRYNTSYMSEGTDITVNFGSSQSIDFDLNQPTTAQYGDTITMNARMLSPVAEQANTDLLFSIVTPTGESAKAEVVSQSYDPSTGLATATIKPLTGAGTFTVAIDKEGDANSGAATQVTKSVTLSPKPITVKPTKFTKSYKIGETMPALSSECDGLVNNDTIPSQLSPTLVNTDGSSTMPYSNGKVSTEGTWKLIYDANVLTSVPQGFKDKYDITLQDYNDDSTLVFETVLGEIPDGWIIVSPNANSEGWNNTDVVVSLHQDAINAGYTTIEIVNDAGTVLKSGSSITYDNETTGITAKARLSNGTHTTDPKELRLIKIDKTLPSLAVSVEHENDWAKQKTVELSASDTLSGMSGASSITINRDGTAYTPVVSDDKFTFIADQDGTYVITVTDLAGNARSITKEIGKIDNSTISLTATPEPLSAQKPKQKISLTFSIGTSGISSFNVYHKEAGGTYSTIPLDDLKVDAIANGSPMDWYAEMNGVFKFELINHAGEKVEAEVTITQINPPKPVTKIEAVYDDDPTKAYTCNTWTNHPIRLTVSNANTEVTDPVIFEYSEDDGATWKPLTQNPMVIDTQIFVEKTILFKGKVNDAIVEESDKKFIVKIDKELPKTPAVTDASNYTQNQWYAEDVSLSITAEPKASGISQTIYMCEGTESVCTGNNAIWTATNGSASFTQNGSHELYFKTIDEAGNESAISDSVYVNINDTKPQINIRIENDPVKELLKNATLGFFFKDTVNIDIEVNFSGTQSGSVYYIIESDDTKPAPTESDARWTLGTSTSIEPDAKGKIYVKAVSDAGILAYEDSVLSVYADRSAPVITLPNSDTNWRNTNELEVSITDALSGVDPNSLTYQGGTVPSTAFTLTNGQATISNLVDGDYDITFHASDYSGNPTRSTVHVKIDTEKPVISTPSVNVGGWSKTREVTFNITDALSGVKEDTLNITNDAGDEVTVNKQEDGSYTFEVNENGSYTIKVQDHAGNEQILTYTEDHIDTTPPVISNIVIEHEHDVWISKDVTFDVTDVDGEIKDVKVTYVDQNGQTKTVNVTKGNDDSYSFTAKENAVYTIIATDKAGNTAEETVTISQIDTTGIAILDVSDITTWVKDQMDISFAIREGSGGLSTGYPKVECDGQASITPTVNNGRYEFSVTQNTTCTITAKNNAGQTAEETLVIERIDTLAPVIDQVSSNTTSSDYRPAQTITFHVSDYNDSEKTEFGSGLDSEYPKVSYIKDGKQEYVTVTQDPSDPTKYSFVADQNTTYTAEAKDAVGHEPVTLPITVDHILEDDMMTSIIVNAYNGSNSISSSTWVKGTIRFEISGGLDASILEKYQVAITEGDTPVDSDFMDLNQGIDEHEVTGNVKGKTYWFRAVPVLQGTSISKPFVVNLDNTRPDSVQIHKKAIHTNPISRFIRAVTFGNWMKEAQEVTFSASDNFTDPSDLQYLYAEERNGVVGQWKPYTGSITYETTDIILHVKAIDLAGNESNPPLKEALQIDSEPPIIEGVQDQKEYKQYYLPRFVTVKDVPADGSGLDVAKYKKDGTDEGVFTEGIAEKIKDEGSYTIYAKDLAGNEVTLTFKIVKLPDIETEIDGSDESREIIDQIIKELEEVKDKIDQTEKDNYEKWIKDAEEKWDSLRKKVVEDDQTTSKVEGQDDTTFDPKTELIVEEIPKDQVPVLPKHAIKTYDVYLKKGNTIIQPDGSVKVYLPYDEEEAPIVYEINDDGTVREIPSKKEHGYVTFITDTLKKYAISNTAQADTKKDVCVVGPDGKLDSQDDVCGSDDSTKNDDGSVTVPDGGKVIFPDKEIDAPDGAIINPDGSVDFPDGTHFDPDGNKTKDPDKEPNPNPNPDDGNKDHICVAGPDGKLGTEDDVCGDGNGKDEPNKGDDGSVTVPDGGSVIFPDGSEVELPDGGIIKPDGSVTTPDGDYDKDGNFTPSKKCPTEGKEINVDTNKDGKPDLNIDTNGDCKADLNIDTDDDGIPDVNIDTTLDGRPDYNIDLNNDGKPDVNIGPVNDPWKPSVCKTVGKLEYCSDPYKKPYLNVDTDGDGRPDLNLDLDGDLEADLNIDVDGDNIPDVNIDTTGNGKPDINIDIDNDGEADQNLLKLTKWEQNKDVDGKIKYDTMTGLVPDPALNKNLDGGSSSSGTDAGGVNNSTKTNGTYSNVSTGDVAKTSFWWILVLINGCVTGYLIHKKRKNDA